MSKEISGYGYDIPPNEHAEVTLVYPNMKRPEDTHVIIGLCAVRATGNIRIWYDFDADAYVVERQTVYSWDLDDTICDPGWQTCAMIPAPLPEEA